MWRSEAAACRRSQREVALGGSAAPAVVVVPAVVVRLVVELGLPWLSLFEAVAAAAAVAMPANASRSPQARMERRNAFTSRSIASRRPSGRDTPLSEHRSARLMRSLRRG